MNVELRLLTLLTLLAFPVVANAQFRAAKCEVEPLWISSSARSSHFGLMGAFDVQGGVTSVRSFSLEGTSLIATTGIRFDEEGSKYKLHAIRLAITVSDKEEKEIFESVGSSEASTQYRNGWNLSVTKNVKLDDLIYMFKLRCWDSAGKRPFI